MFKLPVGLLGQWQRKKSISRVTGPDAESRTTLAVATAITMRQTHIAFELLGPLSCRA